MFYEGDVQGALAEAIQQNKIVVCLVRGDYESESVVWENEFFKDPDLRMPLMAKTILIRLIAGSQEANFLAAIYPLPRTPTLVVMQSNGQLKEYLTAGISKGDFKKRILAAVESERDTPISLPAGGVLTPASSAESNEGITSTSLPETAAVVERSLRAREPYSNDAAHKREENTNKQAATEKAEGSGVIESEIEAPTGSKPPDPKKVADFERALLQKRRQQNTRDERARILKRIEDDKAERRARTSLGKGHDIAAKEYNDIQSLASAMTDDSTRPSGSRKASECAIQVRLFDGTTIRTKFPKHNTTREHIRHWVDSHGLDGDTPYMFKQILAPLPNRTISITEEEESLESLGLVPTATLILVPIKDYTSAYTNSTTDYISKGLYTGWDLVSSRTKIAIAALGGLLGSAADPMSHTNDGNSTAPPVPGTTNIRTIGDQPDYPQEQQFYNGNALNFEPRKDEDRDE